MKAVTTEGLMAGFIAGECHAGEKIGWITTIGVLRAYRSQRIGTRLLEECEQRMKLPRVRLCVRRDNLPALKLYDEADTNGEHLEAYYQDGQDAIVLEKVFRIEH